MQFLTESFIHHHGMALQQTVVLNHVFVTCGCCGTTALPYHQLINRQYLPNYGYSIYE